MVKRGKSKIYRLFLEAIPIIIMLLAIPLLKNELILTFAFITIIVVSLLIKYESRDYIYLIFGFIALTISEYLFVSTGVETFTQTTLFGIMPLWLPLLWAYAFLAIKRGIEIINSR